MGEPWSKERFWDSLSEGTSEEVLSHWLEIEPCDCGEEFCHGWVISFRKQKETVG